MQRRMAALAVWALLLFQAGCATSPYPPGPGPRVEPDEKEWRRKSVPLPPLYMEFTSGSGKRWAMVTPFYWQVTGAQAESYYLVPFASYAADNAAKTTRGHLLNYFWGGSPESRYRIGFPLYWSFERPEAQTAVYGPVYQRREQANERRRLVVFPWLFSRETDAAGYDYWGVFSRLIGYEKQVFDGEKKERLWLFFVFHINIA